jgi:PleD family two-component response regulator
MADSVSSSAGSAIGSAIGDDLGLSEEAKITSATPAISQGQAPVNILIVDDDPKNLTVLEAILDDPGYRLVRAESAEQALLALLDDEFALLILDIRMPDVTGFELAKMIKARRKTANAPIISRGRARESSSGCRRILRRRHRQQRPQWDHRNI